MYGLWSGTEYHLFTPAPFSIIYSFHPIVAFPPKPGEEEYQKCKCLLLLCFTIREQKCAKIPVNIALSKSSGGAIHPLFCKKKVFPMSHNVLFNVPILFL
jgi:hypothetical protein